MDFWQTGALTGTPIKAISQAVSTLPVGGRRLGEVVLLQGRQLGETVLEGNGLKGRKMCLGYDTYISRCVYA